MQTVNNIFYNPSITGHFFLEPFQFFGAQISEESALLTAAAISLMSGQTGVNVEAEKITLNEFLIRTATLVGEVAIALLLAPGITMNLAIGFIVKCAFFYLGEGYNVNLLTCEKDYHWCRFEMPTFLKSWKGLGYIDGEGLDVISRFFAPRRGETTGLTGLGENALVCKDEEGQTRAFALLRDRNVPFKNKKRSRDFLELSRVMTQPKHITSTFSENEGEFSGRAELLLINKAIRECFEAKKAGLFVEANSLTRHTFKELGFEEISKRSLCRPKKASFENAMILPYEKAERLVLIQDIEAGEKKGYKEGVRKWEALWLKIACEYSWDEMRTLVEAVKERNINNDKLLKAIERYDSWFESMIHFENACITGDTKEIKAVICARNVTPLMCQMVLSRNSSFSPTIKRLCSILSLSILKEDLESLSDSEDLYHDGNLDNQAANFEKQQACLSIIREAYLTMNESDFQALVQEASAEKLVDAIMPSLLYDVDPWHYRRGVAPLKIPEKPPGVEIDRFVDWFRAIVPTFTFEQLQKYFEDDYKVARALEEEIYTAGQTVPSLEVISQAKARTAEQIRNKLLDDLVIQFIESIKTRAPIIGTPDSAESRELFYKDIESAFCHVIKKVDGMEQNADSRSLRTKVLVDVLRAAGHCGPRLQRDAVKNYFEVVLEVPQTFENRTYQKTDDMRDKLVETALAPKGCESVIYYTNAVYDLGKELGIPGYELIVRAGPLSRNLQQLAGAFNAERDRIRFFGRYVPSAIYEWIALDLAQDMEYRNKCIDWFKARTPADWTSEKVTEANALLKTMLKKRKNANEIRKALQKLEIQINEEQSPQEAIEAERQEDYVAKEVQDIVNDRPTIKAKAVYKMLEELRILRNVPKN